MDSPSTQQMMANAAEQLTLFGPSPIDWAYPSPTTKDAIALKIMLSGNPVNHKEFITITGSWRLAAYIERLKDLGWPIEKFDTPHGYGGHPIANYYLPEWVLNEVQGLAEVARVDIAGCPSHVK